MSADVIGLFVIIWAACGIVRWSLIVTTYGFRPYDLGILPLAAALGPITWFLTKKGKG